MAATDDASQVNARNSSNLAVAFKVAGLSPERRRGMEVFYAFCREADDIADEPGRSDEEKRRLLDLWRATIRGYYDDSAAPHDRLGEELREEVKRFAIPMQPLLDIIDGVAMDIGSPVFNTADETRRYCYGVASAVGLASIRIFGCKHPMSEEFAVTLGYALQFTNILRDVVDDRINLKRVYLPADEMAACGVSSEDLIDPAGNREGTLRLFRLQYFRAKHYFNRARRLVHPDDRAALKPAFVMGAFYEAILEKIRAGGFRIVEKRTRLTKWEKVRLLRRVVAGTIWASPGRAPARVVVVGGGVAGVAAAAALAADGHTVRLLEAKAGLGGRAGSFRHAATGVILDNGQHAVMGCYDSFLKLTGLLGVDDKFHTTDGLDVRYRTTGGRASHLVARWPDPVHGLGAILGFSELSFADKLSILSFGVRMRLGAKPNPGETGGAWLRRLGATPGAIRALWEPFCLAALNETLDRGDAGALRETLRRSIFGDRASGSVLLAKGGLADVFDPELELFLGAIDGEVVTKAQVRALRRDGDRVVAAELADGTVVEGDVFVVATGWRAAGALVGDAVLAPAVVEALGGNVILNVHLFTDRPVTKERMVGVLDSPVQWVFDRTEAGAPKGLHRCAVTLSAPPESWASADAETIVARTVAELEKVFPESKGFKVVHHFVCKCKDATFATRLPEGVRRPGAATVTPNLFLAGDWVDTGLPATLESAAQSGFDAARAIG